MNEDPRPKILTVDDRPENLLAMETALRPLDADMLTAPSGNAALSLTMRHDFAVVLLDVQMPDMDGFETAALMKDSKRTRHTPLIFVTAIRKGEGHAFRGYETGAVDYLFKPVDPGILRAKVEVFLQLERQKNALKREIARREDVEQQLQQRAEQLELTNVQLFEVKDTLSRVIEQLDERNQELEAFSSVAAHDLKSPLHRIAGFADVLRQEYPEGEQSGRADKCIDVIASSARQMARLVEDLLSYARIGKSQTPPEPVDLGQVVEKTLENLEVAVREAQGHVRVERLPSVVGDEVTLAQLMQNLIANAIKFRGQQPPVVKIAAACEGDRWHVTVEDNGIGIAPEHRDKIFGAFERLHSQTEYEGSGIGLATCRKIVSRHGGRIWLESEQGKGTTFHLTLPGADTCVQPQVAQF